MHPVLVTFEALTTYYPRADIVMVGNGHVYERHKIKKTFSYFRQILYGANKKL